MEMALIINIVAAVLAIFMVYRIAKEIIKNMAAFDESRRTARKTAAAGVAAGAHAADAAPDRRAAALEG